MSGGAQTTGGMQTGANGPMGQWADEQPNSSHLVIELRSYEVVRSTPKGVWLNSGFGKPVFVLGTSYKQFAVPTQELALADLVKRKGVHVSACKARLFRAEEHKAAAEASMTRLAKTKSSISIVPTKVDSRRHAGQAET